jgi:type IV fimbrial biogenesis protein FimT
MSRVPNHAFRSSPSRLRGFTLVELMVVIAMVAILLAIAVPSWTQMQARAAVRAAINDLNSSLQFARSEAVRLNSAVTLCPSADGANCANIGFESGWIVRTGLGANAAGQTILQDTLPRVRVRLGPGFSFTFLPNGLPATNFVGATVTACPTAGGTDSAIRSLVIGRAGRIDLNSPAACPF